MSFPISLSIRSPTQQSYQGGEEHHKSLAQRSSLGALDAIQHRDFANGFIRETLTLCDRNLKNIWRNPELFVARIVLMVSQALEWAFCHFRVAMCLAAFEKLSRLKNDE